MTVPKSVSHHPLLVRRLLESEYVPHVQCQRATSGGVAVPWVGCVGVRVGKSDMSILGERFPVGCVLVRRVLGALEVSR